MSRDSQNLMDRGAQGLMEELGIIGAERFIALVLRGEKMDAGAPKGSNARYLDKNLEDAREKKVIELMQKTMDTEKLLERGKKCLREKLGIIDAKEFVTNLRRESFDYTEWQRTLFADEDLKTLNAAASAWAQEQ